LIADIRKIFFVCEKYYSYDANSIRISRTLESFFEAELKNTLGAKASKIGDTEDLSIDKHKKKKEKK